MSESQSPPWQLSKEMSSGECDAYLYERMRDGADESEVRTIRRVRRMIRNREYARLSRERAAERMTRMTEELDALRREASRLSAEIVGLRRELSRFVADDGELTDFDAVRIDCEDVLSLGGEDCLFPKLAPGAKRTGAKRTARARSTPPFGGAHSQTAKKKKMSDAPATIEEALRLAREARSGRERLVLADVCAVSMVAQESSGDVYAGAIRRLLRHPTDGTEISLIDAAAIDLATLKQVIGDEGEFRAISELVAALFFIGGVAKCRVEELGLEASEPWMREVMAATNTFMLEHREHVVPVVPHAGFASRFYYSIIREHLGCSDALTDDEMDVADGDDADSHAADVGEASVGEASVGEAGVGDDGDEPLPPIPARKSSPRIAAIRRAAERARELPRLRPRTARVYY